MSPMSRILLSVSFLPYETPGMLIQLARGAGASAGPVPSAEVQIVS